MYSLSSFTPFFDVFPQLTVLYHKTKQKNSKKNKKSQKKPFLLQYIRKVKKKVDF